MPETKGTILALDVGDVRIGVASASLEARLPSPLTTLKNTPEVYAQIAKLAEDEQASAIVIGLPRGLGGQETAQTEIVRKFGETLGRHTNIPLYWIDEAATSLKAKAELADRGKPYAKEDVDSLAATYILEDYLREGV